jgi:hypothetical protein
LPDFHFRHGRRGSLREPNEESYCESYDWGDDQRTKREFTNPGLDNLALLIGTVYRPDEPVTTAGQGLYKPGVFRGVIQRLTQTLNGLIKALIEIYKSVGRPELIFELLP